MNVGASLVAQLVKKPPAIGRPEFNPWVGKIPWKRERLPNLVFWPGEFHELYSPRGRKESDKTEQLSLSVIHLKRIRLILFYLLVDTEVKYLVFVSPFFL